MFDACLTCVVLQFLSALLWETRYHGVVYSLLYAINESEKSAKQPNQLNSNSLVRATEDARTSD